MKYSKCFLPIILSLLISITSIRAQVFIGLKANTTIKSISVFKIQESFYFNTDTTTGIQHKPKIDLAYQLVSTDGVHAHKKIMFRVDNGSFQDIGWYGKPIRPYLSVDKEAYAQFLKYNHLRFATTFFLVTTIGGLAGITYSVLTDNSSDSFIPPGGLVFGISFCAGFITSVAANKHLRNAVRIYNKNAGYDYTDGLERRRH